MLYQPVCKTSICKAATLVIVALGCPRAPLAQGQQPATFVRNAAMPNDVKRTIASVSAPYGSGLTAELSSQYGFASAFTVGVAPNKLIKPPFPWATTGFVVKIDMNNDGLWEANEFIDYMGQWPGYDENAAAVATFSYPEPTWPTKVESYITWSIEERREGNITGWVASGTAPIVILHSPVVTYAEASPPSGDEPATLCGFASPDGVIDKPLVLVEGYDATNTGYPSELVGALLDTSRGPAALLPLIAAGFDIYVYNHGNATTGMDANAMRLLGALRILHEDVLLAPVPRDTRVVGFSMGGVVARYALAWGEHNGYSHGSDMFVSADAPQQDAWLSTEFQGWLRSVDGSSPTVNAFTAQLKTVAAKQLLHINAFDLPPGVPMPPESRTDACETFFTTLNGLNGDGYPHRTRNIGVSNGRGQLSLPDRLIEHIYPDGWQGLPIADFFVEQLPQETIHFQKHDIWAGSKQPALGPQHTDGARTLWNGRVWLFKVHDPIQVHYRIEIGQYGAPAFIHANSALDLRNVVRAGWGSEDISGWETSGFDEIVISDSTRWHNDLPQGNGAAIVQRLLEEREVVAPSAGHLHPSGADLALKWKWRAGASSADVATSADGVIWVSAGVNVPFTRCNPNDVNSEACYVLPAFALSPSSHCRVRVRHVYAHGTSSVDQESAEFMAWGIDEGSTVCAPSLSCSAVGLSLQIAWDTSIPTDGQDVVEVYSPGRVPSIDTPLIASAASQGLHHVVTWRGTCQAGTWHFVEKSTKSGSGTAKSAVKERLVSACASCPPCTTCELE